MLGELEEIETIKHHADAIWRYAAVASVSVTLTLLGAWATHGVNRDTLQEALKAHAAVINVRLDAIQNNQNRKLDDLVELKLQVEHLTVEVQNIKIAMGIDDPPPKRSRPR